MTNKSWALAFLILLLSPIDPTAASDFYEWTDESGVTHFASSLDEVPAKYRGQAKAPASGRAQAPSGERGTAPAKTAPPSAAAAGEPSSRKFEVPYEAFEGSARRVIIPVTLNDSVTAKLALDTGAPGMVIFADLALRLGLFSRDSGALLTQASGIGGAEAAILTIVDSVSVEGARDTFVPTTVTARISSAFDGLIGMDFVSNYKISIDSQRNVVVFEETSCGPDCRGGHDESWWRRTFSEFRSTRDRWQAITRAADGTLKSDVRSLAEFQARESEKLLQRLDVHASNNAVPRHWR